MKALLLVAAMGLIVLGIAIGKATSNQSKPEYILKPYSGLGSGVLAPGTVLKEQYKDPSSIIGKAEGGVYILEEVRNGN